LLPARFCQSETLSQHTSNQFWRAIVTLVQISRARNGRPKSAKTRPTKKSQVIYLTHSIRASARAQLYQPTGTTLYKFNFPTFECGKVCRCHSHNVYELPALDPQPQPVLEMCHSPRDGCGQAVQGTVLYDAKTWLQKKES